MPIVGVPWPVWAAVWAMSALIAWWAGARRDRALIGVVLGALLGPVGAIAAFFVPYGGDMVCPACGKRTTWAPMPPGWTPDSGASYPHLRCKRCGEIIPG